MEQHTLEIPMLKLFYAPGSCALAPHIALEEAGLLDDFRFRQGQRG